MASAWGSSWGSAWGDSWGAIGGGTPTPTPEIDYGAGSGGRKKRRETDWQAEKRAELGRILEILGEEPLTAPAVAKLKAEHSVKKQSGIDWNLVSLVQDMQAMAWIIQAYEEHQRRLEDEDDSFFMLM